MVVVPIYAVGAGGVLPVCRIFDSNVCIYARTDVVLLRDSIMVVRSREIPCADETRVWVLWCRPCDDAAVEYHYVTHRHLNWSISPHELHRTAYTPTRYIAARKRSYAIDVYDMCNGLLLYTVGRNELTEPSRLGLSVAPSGETFTCLLHDHGLGIVRAESGECAATVQSYAVWVAWPMLSCAYSHDERVIAVGCKSELRTYNTYTGAIRRSRILPSGVGIDCFMPSFAPDDALIAYLGPQSRLYVMDALTLAILYVVSAGERESVHRIMQLSWYDAAIVVVRAPVRRRADAYSGDAIEIDMYDPVDLRRLCTSIAEPQRCRL
jgi:hypothetical protein